MAIDGIKSVFFTPIRGWKMPGESDTLLTDSASILERKEIDIAYAIKNDPDFYQMDGVISENYTHKINLTRNPVESGIIVTDHSFREPYTVVVDGIITNNPTPMQSTNHIPGTYKFDQTKIGAGLLQTGVNAFTGNRIREAWTGLTELMNERELITVYTALAVYKNMVLTNLSTTNDQKNNLRLNLTFTEAIIIDDQGITTQNKLASSVFGLDLTRILATASSNVSAAIGSL